jgi:hypothetical protein
MIITKPQTQAYRDGWERAFGKKERKRKRMTLDEVNKKWNKDHKKCMDKIFKMVAKGEK